MSSLLKLLFLLALPFFATAQSVEENEEVFLEEAEAQEQALPVRANKVSSENIALREIAPDKWQKASGNLDYSKDIPEPPKPSAAQKPARETPHPDINWHPDWKFWNGLFQILAILIVVGGIAWGVYRFMEEPRNRQIARDGTEITLENVEEYLHESDLDRFLRAALGAGNYALAVRLYFLQCIKSLSEKGQIRWSKEKTNRDYLREMRKSALFQAFREATNRYERVWYGNAVLTEAGFRELEPSFRELLTKINA